MRNIKEGDRVKAVWVVEESMIEGVVESSPQDTGDLWYIKTDDGHIFAINPTSKNFDCFIKEPTK